MVAKLAVALPLFASVKPPTKPDPVKPGCSVSVTAPPLSCADSASSVPAGGGAAEATTMLSTLTLPLSALPYFTAIVLAPLLNAAGAENVPQVSQFAVAGTDT